MSRAGQFVFALSFLFAAGCAHHATNSNGADLAGSAPSSVKEVESFHLNDPEPPQVVDQELEVIPTEMNDRVAQWISYFQHKGRPHMERYLARSTRYSTLMKRILRENGLPEDLIYIALIESGFSSRATSRAAAVGYWQFIKGTGRRYGLEINALVDERRDPVMSTQAAAEYFKGLYSVFGSWYLAMASYNVGENRVKREVMKHYTRDFWELARKRRFPKETVNYIPKFIAAKMIAKNPAKYGFTEIDYEKPIEFEVVKIEKPVNLKTMAEKMGLDYDDFKQLNPRYRGEIAPPKASGLLELRVPSGQTSVAMGAAKEAFVDKIELIADAGDTETYKIRSGDSLYTIARKYRTTVSVLRDINDLKKGRKLRVGMRIQVPERSGASAKKAKALALAKAEKAAVAAVARSSEDQEKAMSNPEIVKNGSVYYVVQPGDTLSAIADDYDSSIAELRKMNKLGKGGVLRAGMRLRVPKDEGLAKDPTEEKAKVASDVKAEASEQAGMQPGETAVTPATPNDEPAKEQAPAEAAASPGVLTPVAPAAAVAGSTVNQTVSEAPAAPAPAAGTGAAGEHVVRSGENLTTIAHKYGVSVPALRKANNMNRRSVLRTGSRLVIPAGNAQAPSSQQGGRQIVKSSAYKMALKRKPAQAAAKKAQKIHVVRRGENLFAIAARYGISLDKLRRHNALNSHSKVLVGAHLLIPD